jgi:predicted transposase YbfD/YdcC
MVSWYTIFFDVPSATTRGWTMADEVRISLDQIVRHFESLEDPRSTVNRRHPLISVVVIAMMGVLAGASGPTAIARWARLKEDLLEQSLDLPHGVPSKDVFLRVLATLKPGAFQACFASWLQSLRDDATAATGVEQPVLAFDGKTLRRSHDRKNGLGALHCVSVWASELGLTLGQVACEEKSNEITAIPQLLKLIDIKGAIITIDAMGTQKAIAAEIIEGEADYVLAVKGNQGTLFHSVVAHFNDQILAGLPRGTVQRHVTRQTGHGRQETQNS